MTDGTLSVSLPSQMAESEMLESGADFLTDLSSSEPVFFMPGSCRTALSSAVNIGRGAA